MRTEAVRLHGAQVRRGQLVRRRRRQAGKPEERLVIERQRPERLTGESPVDQPCAGAIRGRELRRDVTSGAVVATGVSSPLNRHIDVTDLRLFELLTANGDGGGEQAVGRGGGVRNLLIHLLPDVGGP